MNHRSPCTRCPIGGRQTPAPLGLDALKKRAEALEPRFGLEFVEFVSRLRMTNQHNGGRLLL